MKLHMWKVGGAVLAVAGFICSCTTDEADVCLEPVTVTVRTSGMSRADNISIPNGYSMRCILQLVDENSAKLGEQKVVSDILGEASFVISAEERATAKKALLWADYIDSSKKSHYNTNDLLAVTYSDASLTYDMSKTDPMSFDAFCGKVDALDRNISVTLTRPLVDVRFVPDNPEVFSTATSLTASYKAPSVYNVLTQTSSKSADVTLKNPAFKASATPWIDALIFAPVNMQNLGSDITLTVAGGLDKTISLPAGSIPLNANYQITLTANLETPDITISMTVNPNFGSGADTTIEDGSDTPSTPETPTTGKFEVGAFIAADGTVTTDRSKALAVVYHTGAIGSDNAGAYTSLGQTTIKGYAVALTDVSPTEQTINAETSVGKRPGNGWQHSALFLEDIAADGACDFATAYNAWTAANPISGSKVSSWYIPEAEQLSAWLNMIYETDGVAATGTAAFRNLFTSSLKDPATYATCTVTQSGYIRTIRVQSGTATTSETHLDSSTPTALRCRPIVTIFE